METLLVGIENEDGLVLHHFFAPSSREAKRIYLNTVIKSELFRTFHRSYRLVHICTISGTNVISHNSPPVICGFEETSDFVVSQN